MRSQIHPRTVVVVLFTAALFLAALYITWELRELIRWCLLAVFVAVSLNPAVNWLAARRVPRSLAIILVYVALALLLLALLAALLPPLVSQLAGLSDFVIGLLREPRGALASVRDFANQYGLGRVYEFLSMQLQSTPGRLVVAAGPLFAVTKAVLGGVISVLSILLIAFFLLLDGQLWVDAAVRLLPPSRQPVTREILHAAARAVFGYITGNLAISVIAGGAALVALELLRVPYPVALALVVALFDLVPLVGATAGAVIVVVVGFFLSPLTGIILIAYFLVYQQVENNLLQPLVYGRSVHLHPAVVFLAAVAGAKLLGILGALLAIPVAEVIRIILVQWWRSRAATSDVDREPTLGD